MSRWRECRDGGHMWATFRRNEGTDQELRLHMSHPVCNTWIKVMRWTLLVASVAYICPGCDPDSKVQQVQRGIENVELHAKAIEGEADSGQKNASKK